MSCSWIGALALCLTLSFSPISNAQVFADPTLHFTWHTEETALTYDVNTAEILCQQDWNNDWDVSTVSFDLLESFTENDGGCPLTSLSRSSSFRAIALGPSAQLSAQFGIGASAITDINALGHATGSMHGACTASVRVENWVRADLLFSFRADIGRENATTSLAATFSGPIDPETDSAVLITHSWTGSDHDNAAMNQVLLAPGLYRLDVETDAAFRPTFFRRYQAIVSASAHIENPSPGLPPPEWDLDSDGWVGLSDACAWADQPTDADGDGQTTHADLELIMALARATGELASDNDGDGRPEQCSGCLADFNLDGNVDFFDVQSYLGAFAAHAPAADFTDDGMWDFFDILEFLNAFSAGCNFP